MAHLQPLTGPSRAFACAVLDHWPELTQPEVASQLAGTLVGPVHRAFANFALCGYLADTADATSNPAHVRALRADAARLIEVVRRNGLEAEAWRAMAYLAEANGMDLPTQRSA